MNKSLQTIALECGVSAMTVSRALDPAKSRLLAPKTLAKIRDAVRRNGYVANDSARRLKLGRLDTITLVLGPNGTNPISDTIFNAFTDTRKMSLLRTVVQTARSLRFEVKIECSLMPGDTRNVIESLKKSRTDGILLDNASEMLPVLAYAEENNLPHIIMRCDQTQDDPSTTHQQLLDRRPGLAAAVAAQLAKNRARIHFIGVSEMESSKFLARVFRELAGERAGFFQTVADLRGLRELLADRRLLLRDSALFCANDCMADCASRELSALGFAAPDDLAVIGYDDNPRFPTLSTIRVPNEEMADCAVRKLINKITGSSIGGETGSIFATSYISRTTD